MGLLGKAGCARAALAMKGAAAKPAMARRRKIGKVSSTLVVATLIQISRVA
jgi:hypothetical protein